LDSNTEGFESIGFDIPFDVSLLVTRLWLDFTKSWLDSDTTQKKFRWLWRDKYDSDTSLLHV